MTDEIRIVPVRIAQGHELWIEVADVSVSHEIGAEQVGVPNSLIENASRGIEKAVDSTIRSVSQLVLRSVTDLSREQPAPEKLCLEFAIKFVGEAAIPTVAKGSAEANIVVKLEWLLKGKEGNHEL